jgi:N-acyl homoserine lactone hydrolase
MAKNDPRSRPTILKRSRDAKIWPLLTGTHRYEKSVSTKGIGDGVYIDAPILAYLAETPDGRIFYDVGCDYSKIADPKRNARYFDPMRPQFDPPIMRDEQRIPRYLDKLGLTIKDIDVVFLGHLHFDHAGGICDVPGCEIHCHADELAMAQKELDDGIFPDELAGADQWKLQKDEYTICPGVQALNTPGHTAGHMSLFIELPKGPPVILCGDAADLVEIWMTKLRQGTAGKISTAQQ